MLLEHLGLRTKLTLLAGVPVFGALFLATMVIDGARQSARTAEAIGSIEDLAELSESMRDVVSALQAERARTAAVTGQNLPVKQSLASERAVTDARLLRLETFVSARDPNQLPPRLARELGSARSLMAKLPKFRAEVDEAHVDLQAQLDFYSAPTLSLIGAISALTELSEDGTLLRGISSLASTMEVKERQSQEHALLTYVFAVDDFPPGMFRRLVTLDTEEQVFHASFARSASEKNRLALDAAEASESSKLAASFKKRTLESSEDELGIDPKLWFEAQAKHVDAIESVEKDISAQVRRAAGVKLAAARRAVQVGTSLAVAVVVGSLALALLIALGLARSIQALLSATERVRVNQDFSVRAQRRSRDEIGKLADAFNDMLSWLQDRDREILEHREGLERIVDERTQELKNRTAAMRLVLDNVSQGLATVSVDGRLSAERSAAFDRWFGVPPPERRFAEHIGGLDVQMVDNLAVSFEQVFDGILPVEVSLDMMPRSLVRDRQHFALEYTPLAQGDHLDGLLLMITDVTDRVHAERAEVEQREKVKAFERVLRDRTGFIEFFTDARRLVQRIRDDDFRDDAERRRVVHTLKGNSSLFELETIVTAAHALETAFDEDPQGVEGYQKALVEAWDAFAARTVPLLGEDLGDRVELSKSELDALLALIRRGVGRAELESTVAKLAFEPMRIRLERIRTQLQGLARRLHKPIPTVTVKDGGVRLPPTHFAPIWNCVSHLVRNVVDHGLEDPTERIRAGKPQGASVELSAAYTPDGVVIVVSDDGRGIDWERVRTRAKEKGLPHRTRQDLVSALLTEHVSTASTVTATSGRGVGLAAVAAAVAALHGTLTIESEEGKGTRFTMRFGAAEAQRDEESPRLSLRPLSSPPQA